MDTASESKCVSWQPSLNVLSPDIFQLLLDHVHYDVQTIQVVHVAGGGYELQYLAIGVTGVECTQGGLRDLQVQNALCYIQAQQQIIVRTVAMG